MTKFLFLILQVFITAGIVMNYNAMKTVRDGSVYEFYKKSRNLSLLLLVASILCFSCYMSIWIME